MDKLFQTPSWDTSCNKGTQDLIPTLGPHPLKPAPLEPAKPGIYKNACCAQGQGDTRRGHWVASHAGETHRVRVTIQQNSEPPTPGDRDEGLCGLEKYRLTPPPPPSEGWTLYSATSQRLSLFNAFNTFQMVKLL